MALNLTPLVNDMNRMTCPTHQKHPAVTRTGDNVNIKACCEEFRDSIMEKYKSGLAAAGKKAILDAFKKGLR